MVKKGLAALGLLLTQQILLFEHLRLIFCDALRDLIPFVQSKKCEKHPSRIITMEI